MKLDKKAIAFVDPYWFGPESHDLTQTALQAIEKKLPSDMSLERVYLYTESDDSLGRREVQLPCTTRICARDAIDDGYELVRAMDTDMLQLAQSGAFSVFLVASLDDRLALSIERVKAQGICVYGLKSTMLNENDPSFRRMSQIFDYLIEPFFKKSAKPIADENVYDECDKAIDQAIEQWFVESDEISRDSAIEFMNARRGLPKMVDSRLLFLCSQALQHELSEKQKIELRRRFRQVAYERVGAEVNV